jgi:hypothetical protein
MPRQNLPYRLPTGHIVDDDEWRRPSWGFDVSTDQIAAIDRGVRETRQRHGVSEKPKTKAGG